MRAYTGKGKGWGTVQGTVTLELVNLGKEVG
jgi:hypothetical protein